MNPLAILECNNIFKSFDISSTFISKSKVKVHALNGVNFYVKRGEIVGIVGESGSGKTTLAKIITNIYKPDSGNIYFNKKNIHKDSESYSEYRKNVQMVFQDPYSSLNPRLKIISTLKDGIKQYITNNKKEIHEICKSLIKSVGLEEDHLYRYPHQFSGGQRQRISIARALSVDPEVIVADEPVSALDVSVQAQILNLFKKLNKEKNKTIILISHDLAVVNFLCHRVYVMYKGFVVEMAETEKLLKNPLHPYTYQLINSKHLQVDEVKNENVKSSCPYAERCKKYSAKCDNEIKLIEVGKNHFVRCAYYE
ncbi:ABC transporter ATP-binding protein [Deferribacter autotrophicus]|uniref:ABC transporter ATP-binding protein n=1 Tax=Deferribacter autotrophicus TaxID=500465 RepID=A0A5A8F5V7_9BACT|nr:oligopeptide/dipeptide ABC transporter ATP-binding protein [Deferribacter autotrophicus]KAA0258094.1 ABC transporter ATP-binding protein [Deferribacter autotrophicus]